MTRQTANVFTVILTITTGAAAFGVAAPHPANRAVSTADQALPTTTAPDLRLEWITERDARGRADAAPAARSDRPVEPGPIEGQAGDTVRLRYRIRNVGATDAFAVIVRVHTGLGSGGPPVRIQPGPSAGKSIDRVLDLALAVGIGEVCIGAVLQTVRADDPRDPFADDNRICRRAAVRPAKHAAKGDHR